MSKKYRLLAILLSVLLVFSGWGGLLPEQLLAASNDQPGLFFSEYVESGPKQGNNKALEIYNPTGQTINLDDYILYLYINGANKGDTTNVSKTRLTFNIEDSDSSGEGNYLEPGKTFVIVHSLAEGTTTPPLKSYADMLWNNLSFNGNDALVLYKGDNDSGTVIDRIGRVGENPDAASTPKTGWSGDGVQTADRTLIRMPTIWRGDPSYNNVFDPSQEWFEHWKNTEANGLKHELGSHDINQYEVTFDPGEYGTITSVETIQTLYHGQNAVAPTVTPYDGYEHIGWLPEDLSSITEDTTFTAQYQQEAVLFFSEYIEGSVQNKAIEIFNYTDRPVDLSDFEVVLYVNGSSTPTNPISLSGELASKAVFVIAHPDASANELSQANLEDSILNHNGNDAIVLRKTDGTIVDCIGQIGDAPDKEWMDQGVSTLDMTLIRKPSVKEGYTDCYQLFIPSIEWIGLPKDTFNFIGNLDLPEYAVTFQAGDHGRFKQDDPEEQIQYVAYGSPATAPEIEVNAGYKFDGWNQEFTEITKALTVKARYKKESYEVTFTINGIKGEFVAGAGALNQSIHYQEGALSPQVKPKTDYTFIGWDKDFRKVTSPLDVTAQYQDWDYNYLDLFFSKYIEGSGYNKALEIFNPTAQEINLSSDGYKVVIFHNYNENPPPIWPCERDCVTGYDRPPSDLCHQTWKCSNKLFR